MNARKRLEQVNALIWMITRHIDRTPESMLMVEVFRQAVRDVYVPRDTSPSDVESAKEYLSGDLPHLQALGLDPDWVKSKFAQAGYCIN